MIFGGRREDREYHRWFAWYPVRLNGPDEWDRMKRLWARPRWAWLRMVWRMRGEPSTYYTVD